MFYQRLAVGKLTTNIMYKLVYIYFACISLLYTYLPIAEK